MPERRSTSAEGVARGSEQREDPRRYGPGLPLYVTFLTPIALGVWALTRAAEGPAWAAGGLVLLAVGVCLPCLVWRSYRLGAEGVDVHGPGVHRSWTWAQVGGVHGSTWAPDGAGPSSGWTGELHRSVVAHEVRYDILDTHGRPLFRISPWTAHRRELAAEIRHRATAARRMERAR